MGKDFDDFIAKTANEDVAKKFADAVSLALEGCKSEDGKRINDMHSFIAKASMSVSMTMLREYHEWLNSDPS